MPSRSRAQKSRRPLCVPDGEREHAAEPGNAVGAILLVSVEDRFGVAASLVAMTGLFELWPDLSVIEDLAVVDDPEVAVFVGHRLMAAGEIDDAQPAVANPRVRI